jgi:hypothetical protein
MAEEKPRAPRAQKKVTETEKEVAVDKTTAKRPSRAKAATSTPKSAKKKTAAATSRPRKAKVVVVQPDDVATLAYLLWERGEPGDADEHWLRAEQELAAA